MTINFSSSSLTSQRDQSDDEVKGPRPSTPSINPTASVSSSTSVPLSITQTLLDNSTNTPIERSYKRTISAQDGQEVTFTYLERTKSVGISLLGKPITDLPESMPQTFSDPTLFFEFLQNRTVQVSLLTSGNTKIDIQKRDLSPYEDALEKLRTHLSLLANPILLEEILKTLKNVSQLPIDGINGILHHFKEQKWPEETKLYLRHYHEQIIASYKNSKPKENTSKIKEDIKELEQIEKAPQQLSEPLCYFFRFLKSRC